MFNDKHTNELQEKYRRRNNNFGPIEEWLDWVKQRSLSLDSETSLWCLRGLFEEYCILWKERDARSTHVETPGGNVLTFRSEHNINNHDCIKILDEYLAAAKAGEIVAVAVAALEPNTRARHAASGSSSYSALVGAVSLLQRRVLTNEHGE